MNSSFRNIVCRSGTNHGTNPDNSDSDGGRLNDGIEIAQGSNPIDENSWPNTGNGDFAPRDDPDGRITAVDTLIAIQPALGIRTQTPLQYAYGDVYFGSAFNIADVQTIQQLVLQ